MFSGGWSKTSKIWSHSSLPFTPVIKGEIWKIDRNFVLSHGVDLKPSGMSRNTFLTVRDARPMFGVPGWPKTSKIGPTRVYRSHRLQRRKLKNGPELRSDQRNRPKNLQECPYTLFGRFKVYLQCSRRAEWPKNSKKIGPITGCSSLRLQR